ncbi:phage tail protein [Dyella sp. M7H15-1]|uniref:phage tail protein n=1 Tax=Dyella sp. M7H15-1 TaxID=2501295 RepID=UPI0010050333|nr:phage tail protein [Dyella sp. M7H15-1]QAU22605.1 phage tail protein [Dyella sp. M7H15-1]
MYDLSHYWSGDCSAAANGDLLTASDTERAKQRILRRLLTNPAQKDAAGNVTVHGDYIFHPDYGAGLPRLVGSLASPAEIRALIRGQMLLEASVARNPAPNITVTSISDGISVQINYTDASSGTPIVLAFNVSK